MKMKFHDNHLQITGYLNGLAQDCSNSSALAMELLLSCSKPEICVYSDT